MPRLEVTAAFRRMAARQEVRRQATGSRAPWDLMAHLAAPVAMAIPTHHPWLMATPMLQVDTVIQMPHLEVVTDQWQVGMTSGVRPAAMTSGVRPAAMTSGVRPAGTTSGVRPAGTTSGVRPAAMTSE